GPRNVGLGRCLGRAGRLLRRPDGSLGRVTAPGPRMIPAMLPAEIRADPKRSAEVQVFDRLRDDPMLAGFTVFYSCEWIGAHDGLLKDGEADFVLAHPAIGFLVIEVKGGRV